MSMPLLLYSVLMPLIWPGDITLKKTINGKLAQRRASVETRKCWNVTQVEIMSMPPTGSFLLPIWTPLILLWKHNLYFLCLLTVCNPHSSENPKSWSKILFCSNWTNFFCQFAPHSSSFRNLYFALFPASTGHHNSLVAQGCVWILYCKNPNLCLFN